MEEDESSSFKTVLMHILRPHHRLAFPGEMAVVQSSRSKKLVLEFIWLNNFFWRVGLEPNSA